MDFNSPNVKKYFGKNWVKDKKNYQDQETQAETKFMVKCPYRKIGQFEFRVNINQDGSLNHS